jgi:ABC-type multidrug transport system ATPase subunit
MNVLKIENLQKSYGSIKAVKGLSLSIEQGMVFGLLGPNGSGKTTTLGIILGVLMHDLGSYCWFDDIHGEAHRKKIGAILETPNFYPYLDAIDNLKIVAKIKQVKNSNIESLLEIVDLSHRKNSKFSSYSLGMKQRLAIASSLIGDPEVLIFDEPTNGLDPQGIAEVRHILKKIAMSGKTVIMASHMLDEVEKICTHVGIMKFGKLLAVGPVGSILNNDLYGEIGANDIEKLRIELSKIEGIVITSFNGLFIECTINNGTTAEQINKILSEKGIYVNHLLIRKQKLEEEFLQITNNSNLKN